MIKRQPDNVLIVESHRLDGTTSIREFNKPIDWHMLKREIERTRTLGSMLVMKGVAP